MWCVNVISDNKALYFLAVQCYPLVISHSHSFLFHPKTNLGDKDQTERNGAAKDDHQSYNAKLDIGLVSRQKRHGGTDDAHDAHVVHAHPDVFAVVESWDANVPRLPCQETTKQLMGK